MEPINQALALLKRQAELQNAVRRGRGNPVLEERELYLIRQQLACYPAAMQAIAMTSYELRRPVTDLLPRDVEKRC